MIANAPLNLWAQEGGILGLIIFTLFGVLLISIRELVKNNKKGQEFFTKMNEDARIDRREAREERKEINAEHSQNYNRLSDSLDRLTEQLRTKD